MRKRLMKKMRGGGLIVLVGLLITVSVAVVYPTGFSSVALDDDEFSGYRAEKLCIEVGYFGGPYYPKAEYTVDQLRAIGTVKADYTFIDNMPSVIIDHVEGVRLSDVIDNAKIDLNSVESFSFFTNDKKGGKYSTKTKSDLIDTPRYCYYSLPENFDSVTGTGNASAGDIKERVDTVLAVSDDWTRCIAGAEFGSDYQNLNSNTRFRLIFGQTDTYTHNASDSAKWINKIEVTLGGKPSISLSDSTLEGKIGSVLTTRVTTKAADSVISDANKVEWSSSDESIATVDQDGNITVTGEGTAIITASFAGATAQLTINGTEGEQGGTTAASPLQEASGMKSATSLIPTDKVSASDLGGVQNWRVYEMATDAEELPNQVEKKSNPMLPVMGGSAAGVFVIGFVGRILRFRWELKGRKIRR